MATTQLTQTETEAAELILDSVIEDVAEGIRNAADTDPGYRSAIAEARTCYDALVGEMQDRWFAAVELVGVELPDASLGAIEAWTLAALPTI